MTEKHDLAGYMANILCIMESREDAGIHRGNTLAEEYERTYKRYKEILADEARNRDNPPHDGDEGGRKESVRPSSGPVGHSGGQATAGPVPRQGRVDGTEGIEDEPSLW